MYNCCTIPQRFIGKKIYIQMKISKLASLIRDPGPAAAGDDEKNVFRKWFTCLVRNTVGG